MTLFDLTGAIWFVVTIAAAVGFGWLVITIARVDDRTRRALEQRLARGEIDIDDYRARIALLES